MGLHKILLKQQILYHWWSNIITTKQWRRPLKGSVSYYGKHIVIHLYFTMLVYDQVLKVLQNLGEENFCP